MIIEVTSMAFTYVLYEFLLHFAFEIIISIVTFSFRFKMNLQLSAFLIQFCFFSCFWVSSPVSGFQRCRGFWVFLDEFRMKMVLKWLCREND